jgi:uncharacterized membrane protein YeaQ/YmgE (transglycosylase-associated protein family)
LIHFPVCLEYSHEVNSDIVLINKGGRIMEHHTFRHLVYFLLIGGVIGWMAGLITRGRGFGIAGDVVIGIGGAVLGGWMAEIIGLSISSSFGEFLMAILGAVVLVGLTRFVIRQVKT